MELLRTPDEGLHRPEATGSTTRALRRGGRRDPGARGRGRGAGPRPRWCCCCTASRPGPTSTARCSRCSPTRGCGAVALDLVGFGRSDKPAHVHRPQLCSAGPPGGPSECSTRLGLTGHHAGLPGLGRPHRSARCWPSSRTGSREWWRRTPVCRTDQCRLPDGGGSSHDFVQTPRPTCRSASWSTARQLRKPSVRPSARLTRPRLGLVVKAGPRALPGLNPAVARRAGRKPREPAPPGPCWRRWDKPLPDRVQRQRPDHPRC